MRRLPRTIPAVLCLLAASVAGQAAPPARLFPGTAAALKVLETHCLDCHGGPSPRGGLDLTTREGLLKGGDSGPAVVPGDAKKSRLVLRVTHAEKPAMPFKRDRLADAQTALLAAWIDAGVPYDGPLVRREETWWSLRPLVRPTVP